MKNIVVGCPFSDRGWILDQWIECVNVAFANIGCVPKYIFVVSENSEEDISLLESVENSVLVFSSEIKRSDARVWDESRYHHMVEIRNLLLNAVRKESPDLFLSLDSDILLAPNALSSALDALDKHPDAWGVGLKCYMSPTCTFYPSLGIWFGNDFSSFSRDDVADIATVDIIMAAKLMKPEAYNIDYSFHRNGEDLGWSLNVKLAGGSFIWDGRVINKHVMGKDFLNIEDKRAGF